MHHCRWLLIALVPAVACKKDPAPAPAAAGSGSAPPVVASNPGSGSASAAAPTPAAAGSAKSESSVVWHVHPGTTKGQVIVSLEVAGKVHALGPLTVTGDAAGDKSLGCQVSAPANHLGETALLCGTFSPYGAMRARVHKRHIVVSSGSGATDEGDVKFSQLKVVARFKTTSTSLTAPLEPVVDADAPPANTDPQCKSDADCAPNEFCEMVRDLDEDGKMGPVSGQYCSERDPAAKP